MKFGAASRIPGTPEWRLYRDTTKWIRKSIKLVRVLGFPVPSFPLPLPRNQAAMRTSIESVEEMLHAVKALAEGRPEVAQEWLVKR